MKLLAICLCLVLSAFAAAQNSVELTQQGKESFEANFPSGGQLRLRIRSGNIRITGSDENYIRVRLSEKNARDLKDVKIGLKATGNDGELKISGGPSNHFSADIKVPKQTHLYLRVPAGEVEVSGIVGNKDVELHAGDLNMAVGNAEQYGKVDVSVRAGDLDAAPFKGSKSGLFRHFNYTGSGQYSLHVHVGAGDVVLSE